MSVVTSFSMFYLSFAPLWVSILFIDIKSILEKESSILTEGITVIVIIVFSIFSTIIMKHSLNKNNRNGVQKYVIESVEEEKSITAEYLLSYILPLFVFDFTLWHQVVLFLIFFFVLGFLCIRHNYFSVNIVMELLGYRFYRCQLQNEDNITISKIVITKTKLIGHKTDTISIQPLTNEYVHEVLS